MSLFFERLFVLILTALVLIAFNTYAESSIDDGAIPIASQIDLDTLTIDELLDLQKEIQTVLADKGYVQYDELDRGAKGESVIKVQERLKELGYYDGSLTGKYDTETQKAFKLFEKNNSLVNDGKASQSDLLLLFSSSVKPKATPTPTVAKQQNIHKKDEETPEGYLPFSSFDYTEFFRYPEKYFGTKIILKGRVIQVIGSRSRGYQIRLATAANSDIVYVRVKNDPGFNILEGDRLTVYAEMKNTYTYTSTFFTTVTVPSADADSITLN